MAEWRFARGWADAELARRLAAARRSRRNFEEPPRGMTAAEGWNRHRSNAVIAREAAGAPMPGGPFERAAPLLARFAFSDPRILESHFDADAPLLGRVMLLEVHVLGLRFLAATVVAALRDDSDGERTVRGFRYDTLEGHFERGCEWFLVTKEHASGAITFTIDAAWRIGDLPNFWSRWGFRLLARRYQRAWHRLAHLRMRALLGSVDLEPLPRGGRLVHEGSPLPDMPVQKAASGRPPEPITSEDEASADPAKEPS